MRAAGISPALTRAAAALALAPLAAAATGSEAVISGFDLLGWLRLGVLTVDTPPVQAGGAETLLDGDPRTFAQFAAPAGTCTLTFHPSQSVRRVVAVSAVDGPSRITLTVVEDDGDRFQAGALDVNKGGEAVFRLVDVPVAALEVVVESVDELRPAGLADVLVEGLVVVSSIALEGVPETLPEGGSFPLRVTGRDSFGGRPDLTGLAQLLVQPSPALTFQGGRASTRVQGPVSLEARLGALSTGLVPLLVTPLDPPPPEPEVAAGMRVVVLELEGEPPFEIFRRAAGDNQPVSIGRALRNTYFDDTVLPGMAYSYSTRRVDLLGNARTLTGPESRARTHGRLPPGVREAGRLPLLVAIFTEGLQPGQSADIADAVQAARLFIWRHTLGRVVLDPVVLEISGPVPVTAGPTMVAVEARLRQLGVRDDGFAVVAAVSPEFEGDYAGFQVLGDAAGLLLRGTEVPTPRGVLGPAPGLTFSLLHELQEAAAGLLLEETGESLAVGHPSTDFAPWGPLGGTHGRGFDAGEAWDYAALLLADADGWSRLGQPWLHPMELLDSDGDLLPDANPHVPLDELRLGTDAARSDTDGDGLGDFAELAAGLYRGSQPLSPDSDGDGQPDGLDAWPTSNFTGVIPAGKTPRLLASVPTTATPDSPPIALSACWTRTALTLQVVTDEACDVFVDLDGSGRLGRWESDVNTGSDDAPAGDCWCGPQRITLRAHTAPLGAFVGGRPLRNSLVASERDPDGRVRLTAVLPATLGPGADDAYVPPGALIADGLRLRAGTVLGLTVTVRPSRAGDLQPFEAFPADGSWNSLFETHHFMDAVLQDG